MEDLVIKMEELIQAINNNNVPVWITYVSIIVPIILSVVVIVTTLLQHRQNKQLQKAISDRDVNFQMHEEILKIYSTFEDFHDFVMLNSNLVAVISNNKRLSSFFDGVNKFQIKLSHASNHVKLIFEDKKLKNIISNIHEMFFSFIKEFSEYYNSGKIEENSETAWTLMNDQFKIKKGEYWKLLSNKKVYENFKKLYKDEHVNKLQTSINNLRFLVYGILKSLFFVYCVSNFA